MPVNVQLEITIYMMPFQGKQTNNKVRELMPTHRKCTIPDDRSLESISDVQANVERNLCVPNLRKDVHEHVHVHAFVQGRFLKSPRAAKYLKHKQMILPLTNYFKVLKVRF